MRLIDADAIIPKGTRITQDNVDVATAIRFAPTVDAVPVVRCRECKMWRNSKQFRDNHICFRYDTVTYPDDFCSCGERKGADR